MRSARAVSSSIRSWRAVWIASWESVPSRSAGSSWTFVALCWPSPVGVRDLPSGTAGGCSSGGYTFVQSHFITFDQACNTDFDNDLAEAGPCRRTTTNAAGVEVQRATGIPNPNYRATINSPGRRFKVTDANQFDAWLGATVMF